MLYITTEWIRKGEKSEREIKDTINFRCEKIEKTLREGLNNYLEVLPGGLIEAINSVLFHDMFYMISMRSRGILRNQSLEEILSDQTNYASLWNQIERIKLEVEKI